LGLSLGEGFLCLGPPSGAVREIWQIDGVFQIDEDLIYSLRPSSSRVLTTEEFTEQATVNERGLRDGPLKKPSSFQKRIVVLGDSMTFGHGVNQDETFPNQLEALFSMDGKAVDVLNAGVKGYGPDQSFKFYVTRLQDLSPNLLVFTLFANDVRDCIDTPLYDLRDGRLQPLDAKENWLYIRCKLGTIFPEWILNRRLFRKGASTFARFTARTPHQGMSAAELRRWAQDKILAEIKELKRIGDARGFDLLVLCIPCREGSRSRYSWLDPLKREGVWVLEAHQDPLWQERKSELFYRVDQHFTPKGCEVLARKVFHEIRFVLNW